jgi:hypothetical protein
MNKMKELNLVLEKSLEKANSRKIAKLMKDGNPVNKNKSH